MRPAPVPQPESEFFWQKAKEGELWLRHCTACNRIYFYPRDICPSCFSRATDWIRSGGRGTLHSFAIVHRAPTSAFKELVPYVTAIVELEGGARMPSNLVNVPADPAQIRIGMTVEVSFEQITPDISLPVFRPAR
ncbi:MAG: Zn-ribbon domain-containing OB-fold protein [Alphaproteobacteria bacterium]|nr:Zn-ribbon domain-containing OB-fold protein [Alphaproteobacteria bacterium]